MKNLIQFFFFLFSSPYHLRKMILPHKEPFRQYVENHLFLCYVAKNVDGLALLHTKTLRVDTKILNGLGICFKDAVRLLTIISQFANQKVREKPRSLTAPKDFTLRTQSVYQSKYTWLLFFLLLLFFYVINDPVRKEALL